MNNVEAQKMLKQIRIPLPRLSSLDGSAPEFRESVFNYRASRIPSKLENRLTSANGLSGAKGTGPGRRPSRLQ